MIDELVTLAKERQAVMKDLAARFEALETDAITNCETSYEREGRVHINTGIKALAAECGATVKMSARGEGQYPWEHSFIYDGVLFFEINKTEMPR